MIKRIGITIFYFILWGVTSYVIHLIIGDTNWLETTLVGAIACAAGAFGGYGFGKSDNF